MIKSKLNPEPKYLTTIETGDHIQILDEPVSLGGNNQGPTPVQAVYSALAACISITLRMYADHKKIPLESVEITIEAEKKSVKDSDERFRDKPQMIDKGKVRFIHAIISVSGNLDAEHIQKLDVIAGKCPVHKMLKHGAWITHEIKVLNGK
ncbi:OsmC family protein [Natronogracilivirga saccharolytica]|uniref:OsmC family protein n=1 Tax=Natronogracilivirga saccharolytica TaxID=2812953 RepID=A0A8J7SCM1_9BACT|nr:OsmC family protein [Natronogracilivirga saccharolytica]MBP3193586.1 OsmC family protein [Natronogracilivirga saccharolytica]